MILKQYKTVSSKVCFLNCGDFVPLPNKIHCVPRVYTENRYTKYMFKSSFKKKKNDYIKPDTAVEL